MLKKLLIILIVLFAFTTAFIIVAKPKTHKPVVFENQNFDIKSITDKSTSEKIFQINSLPAVKVEIENKVQKPSNNNSQNTKSINITQIASNNTNSVLREKTKDTQKKVEKKKEIISPKQKQDFNQDKVVKSENIKQNNDTTSQEIINQNKEKPIKKEEAKIILTEEQLEIIAWNKWRSDLQNQLMKDSKITAPIGTTFYYTFTVDKNGNISNIKTWANNPSYTQMAVNRIKPILAGYNKTPIVVFPEKSKRIITNVEGCFTMSYSTKYSTPADYHDYERVVY